jgi:hypothetical protein
MLNAYLEPEAATTNRKFQTMDINSIPDPDRKGLREFGALTGSIVALLFGLFFPWLLDRGIPLLPWVLGGTLILAGIVVPTSLRVVYRLWMRFGLLLNKITTPLILALVFYLIITPTALIMRVLGRHPIARRFDHDAKSYRIPSKRRAPAHMERPF